MKYWQLIHHMNDYKNFEDGVYSNRLGFSALDTVFLEEMQHDYCCLIQFLQIKTDVDAASCYDQIIPSFGASMDFILMCVWYKGRHWRKYNITCKRALVFLWNIVRILHARPFMKQDRAVQRLLLFVLSFLIVCYCAINRKVMVQMLLSKQ